MTLSSAPRPRPPTERTARSWLVESAHRGQRTVAATASTARRGHPGLYAFAWLMAATIVVLVGFAIVDQRTLLGQPVWFKPLKFALSFVAYAGTLAWLTSRFDLRGRLVTVTGWVIVAASALEMVIIIRQAARGVRSHFNQDSAADIALYSVMGATVFVLYLGTIVFAVAALRRRSPDRVAVLAVRAGLVVALLGFAVGYAMVAVNAHAVGVPDGGPGMFLTGWSTTGGDLRVAHFVGMHGLQAIPLTAAAIVAFTSARLTTDTQLRLVLIFATAYGALVLILLAQALRAEPLLSADPVTLAALVAVAVGALGSAAAPVRRSRGALRRSPGESVGR